MHKQLIRVLAKATSQQPVVSLTRFGESNYGQCPNSPSRK